MSAGHDWPVKKAIVNLPIRLKGDSKRIEFAGGPVHGFRHCFADVTDRDWITSTPKSREVLLRILGGGVPPGSPNPDPISDQKMSSSTLVFRPDL